MLALRVKDKSIKDYKECLNPEVDKNLSIDSKITKFLNPSQQTLSIPFQYKTNPSISNPLMKNNTKTNNRHKTNNSLTG